MIIPALSIKQNDKSGLRLLEVFLHDKIYFVQIVKIKTLKICPMVIINFIYFFLKEINIIGKDTFSHFRIFKWILIRNKVQVV